MDTQHLDAIVAEAQSLDPEHFSAWRGGWTNDIELALLDAVLSIQARYETKNGKGVLSKVQAYRAHRGGRADDLRELARTDEADLLAIVGRQVTGGRTKASAAIEAARNLAELGVHHAADFAPDSAEHRSAYTRVTGLGPVTYAYLRMLLGHPDVKADTWVNRFTHRVTGDDTLSPDHVRRLVTAAAAMLPGDVSATVLDHAIWRSEAQREVPSTGEGA
ncbi:hypothetical protein ACX8Z9_13345 [Arthrobacter halodurans]|uniref:Uncharacterized protein n=1 Tax=Arthrobacter halodurans TaxID=516699 RepID=A0ABV4UUW2_9MICC